MPLVEQIKNLEMVGEAERDYDGIMIATAFGILAYSTFTIIAGVLHKNAVEPGTIFISLLLAEYSLKRALKCGHLGQKLIQVC